MSEFNEVTYYDGKFMTDLGFNIKSFIVRDKGICFRLSDATGSWKPTPKLIYHSRHRIENMFRISKKNVPFINKKHSSANYIK